MSTKIPEYIRIAIYAFATVYGYTVIGHNSVSLVYGDAGHFTYNIDCQKNDNKWCLHIHTNSKVSDYDTWDVKTIILNPKTSEELVEALEHIDETYDLWKK